MLHSWGLAPSLYDALPGGIRREMFMWWQAKVERDRTLNEEAKRRQEEQTLRAQQQATSRGRARVRK